MIIADNIPEDDALDKSSLARRVVENLATWTPAEQEAFLDEHCPDPEIRAEVDRLLDHDRSHGGLLAAGIGGDDFSSLQQPDEMTQELWREAGRIWDTYEDRREFHSFVAADYAAVYQALVGLRGRVSTVLEWGSGLGVITIMASNLGFDAYGIESEERLVERARELARKFGPRAQFVTGNFIPSDYEWSMEVADESFRSDVEAESGYESLDMELTMKLAPLEAVCVCSRRHRVPAYGVWRCC